MLISYCRANVFFYAHAALCATEFFGPPIGSILMDRSPWIPLILSTGLLTINIPLALALPETLPKSTYADRRSSSLTNHCKSSNPAQQASIFAKIKSHLPSTGFLTADHRILFILTSSIAYIFAQACSNLTIQYTSRRYAWTLSQSAYLGSVRAAIMLLTLLIGLPLASTYLLRHRSFSPFSKDVLLLRTSFSAVSIGLLVEGLAPDIPTFIIGCCIATVGMGATALIRSLLSTLVQQDEVARLFAVMSLVWTAAMLVASPAVATLFSEGLKRGGIWTGLPFLFAGLLFVVATAAMWLADLTGSTLTEQDAVMNEEEHDGEKEGFLRSSATPQTPAFRFDVEHSAVGKEGAGRRIPAPLMLEMGGRGEEMSGLRRPSYVETPLCSPGLRVMYGGQ